MTKEEFVSFTLEKDDTADEDIANSLFEIFDKDGSGSISLDEWKAYGRISGISHSEADCESTFKHCDLDNNGKLNVEEMTRQHLEFWYTLDPQADKLYGNFVP